MKIEVLGSVQDGGVPHLGCECDICEAARKDQRKQMYSSSLMIKENGNQDSIRYLLEASPDIKYQIKGSYLDGVFLSQGHLGHVGGLPFFGNEGLDASELTVHCSEDMKTFLRNNDPFRLMIDRDNIRTETFKDENSLDVQGGKITPIKIDHSRVNTATVSFMIEGENKKLYYVSDTDRWSRKIEENIREADIAIVDGTFWSKDEIDRYEEVPHPTIKKTMEKFSDTDTEIYFTHMNHTNPVLRKDSEERQEMEDEGFSVVEKGMEFEI